jgi:predicted RND superfamily exporter protein
VTHGWHVLAELICRRRFAIWAVAILVVGVSAYGLTRLSFDTQQDTLVPSSSQLYKDNAVYQSKFGGDQLEVILTGSPLQLLQGQNLARLQQLQKQLDGDSHFLGIISPLTLLNEAEVRIPKEIAAGAQQAQQLQQQAEAKAREAALAAGKSSAQADAAATAAGNDAVQQYIKSNGAQAQAFLQIGDLKTSNPKFVKFVLYDPATGKLRPEVSGLVPDDHHSLLVATMKGNLSVNEQDAAAHDLKRFVADAGFTDGVTAKVAGETLLLASIADSLKSAIPELGIVGLLDLPLTMASTAGLPILIGLSVDFGIQFHNRYEEEFDNIGDARQAMRRSLAAITPALLTAFVAASIGFLALRYSLVPMIRDFSLILIIGIAAVFLACLFVLNGVLFQRDRHKTRADVPRHDRLSWTERGLRAINRATIKRPIPILVLAVVVAAGGFVLDHRIPTETEPQKFIPQDSQILKDLNELSALTSTSNSISFLVHAKDVTDPAVLDWLAQLQQQELAHDHAVTGANSLVALLPTTSSGTPDTSKAAVASALESTPPAIRNSLVTPDHQYASVQFSINQNVQLIDQKPIIDEIPGLVSPPPGVTITPAGLGVIGVEAVARLTQHRISMMLLALAGVFVLVLVVTRNLAYAILTVFPVGMVIGWTSAAMYLFGVPLNPMTSIAGPLVVALGCEFSILLMLRYREERQRGRAAEEAMNTAFIRSGRAITASALTVIGAFLALAFNGFPLLSQFGDVAVIGVALSLAGALFLMPPLLVWADETFAGAVHEATEASH